ncbi:MAG: hypothetical protein IJY71_06915 [Clostridia bacterium]|nr:hypothetical protein [Clostridia bacterium]
MKKALEKLWNDCFAEECAMMNTKEEKALIKKAEKRISRSLPFFTPQSGISLCRRRNITAA